MWWEKMKVICKFIFLNISWKMLILFDKLLLVFGENWVVCLLFRILDLGNGG